MIYTKKPVQIEAHCITSFNLSNVADWCNGSVAMDVEGNAVILIRTLEGEMQARFGDYVIKGVKGEFYPCKPDIFHLTYDEVPE